MSGNPQTRELLSVTVMDREAYARAWNNGHAGPPTAYLRTVEIGDRCAQCGEPRGEIKGYYHCEDDEWFSGSVWTNPCGHLDMYPNVLAEAKALMVLA